MSDKLFDDQPFRILTIVNCRTREALVTAARTNFRAYQVFDELDRIARARGKPRSIRGELSVSRHRPGRPLATALSAQDACSTSGLT